MEGVSFLFRPNPLRSCQFSIQSLAFHLPIEQKLRLDHESEVVVEGTPRRLAVVVRGLAPRQRADESRVRGPPASVRGNTGRYV